MKHEALIRRLEVSCLGLDAVDPLRLLVDDVVAALRQPEQEPDYWLGYGLQAHTEKPFENATALYTHPPQRTEENT